MEDTTDDNVWKVLSITPMENPYEYVKEVQALHDDSKIKFSNEYYDTLGLERPDGSECEAQYTAFTSVIVAVAKGKS